MEGLGNRVMESYPRVTELASESYQTAKDAEKSRNLQTLSNLVNETVLVESKQLNSNPVKSGQEMMIDPVELVDLPGLHDSSDHPTDEEKNITEDPEIPSSGRNNKSKKLDNKAKHQSANILNNGVKLNGRSTKTHKLQSKSATHLPMSKMIENSIKALKSENGDSTQAIRKYIKEHYGVDTKVPEHRYNHFLRTAVENQILEQLSGVGATGRFKLREKKNLQNAKQKSGKYQVKIKPESKKLSIQKNTRNRVQRDI